MDGWIADPPEHISWEQTAIRMSLTATYGYSRSSRFVRLKGYMELRHGKALDLDVADRHLQKSIERNPVRKSD